MNSAPEYYLSRAIRKEMRKESYTTDSRDLQKSFGVNADIEYAEPVLIVSSRGTYHSGYVVPSPEIYERQIPRYQLTQAPRYQLTQTQGYQSTQAPGYQSTQASGYQSTQATRHDYSVKSSSGNSSRPDKCSAIGCRISHCTHYCNVCARWDVTHLEDDCPLYKQRHY